MHTISVVIPTYNRAHIIEKTILSCLHQTVLPKEIIVVDDLSVDNTAEVVKAIQHDLVEIRFIPLTAKGGAQVARNCGIQNATGNWIAFLDSDDEWLPNKLEQQIEALAQNNFDPYTLVHGNCIVINHNANTEMIWDLPIVEGNKPYKTLLRAPSPVFPSILTSKKALEEVGLLDEKVPSYQEWDTALKLASICTFIHLQQPLFIYHIHTGETISKNLKRDVAGYHYLTMKYRNDIISHYGKQFFINVLLSNIKRIPGLKEWKYGLELLKQSRESLPFKSYVCYTACFNLRVNPESVRKILTLRKNQ